MVNNKYHLSQLSEFDLLDIYIYSLSNFGENQADSYVEGFHNLFIQLVKFPDEGFDRSDLIYGLKSILYKKHIVFYRHLLDEILIERILHQQQNVPDHF